MRAPEGPLLLEADEVHECCRYGPLIYSRWHRNPPPDRAARFQRLLQRIGQRQASPECVLGVFPAGHVRPDCPVVSAMLRVRGDCALTVVETGYDGAAARAALATHLESRRSTRASVFASIEGALVWLAKGPMAEGPLRSPYQVMRVLSQMLSLPSSSLPGESLSVAPRFA